MNCPCCVNCHGLPLADTTKAKETLMACAPTESFCFMCELSDATSQLHSKMQHFDEMPLCMIARQCLVFPPEFWEAAGCCSRGPHQSGASCKPSCYILSMRMNLIRSTSPCSPELGNEVWTPPTQGGNFHWSYAASTPHSPPHCQHMELTGHSLGKQQRGDLWHSSHARMRELNMRNVQNKRLSCSRRMWLARNHAGGNMGQSTARRNR